MFVFAFLLVPNNDRREKTLLQISTLARVWNNNTSSVSGSDSLTFEEFVRQRASARDQTFFNCAVKRQRKKSKWNKVVHVACV